MSETVKMTERTRLRRLRERGHYDRETIDSILDAMPMCHIGYQQNDVPAVMPTIQWREGDRVYWHASSGGRGVKAWCEQPVCLTVSLLDGLVLARSGLHHSANYRSVMVFGQPIEVKDPQIKAARLDGLIDHLYPGRSKEIRPMTDIENKQTAVFYLPIEEASAKVRNTAVVDDEEDYSIPVWSGVIPIRMQALEAEPDPRNLPGVASPDYVGKARIG